MKFYPKIRKEVLFPNTPNFVWPWNQNTQNSVQSFQTRNANYATNKLKIITDH